MQDEFQSEFLSLVTDALEWFHWEAEMGGMGVPAISVPATLVGRNLGEIVVDSTPEQGTSGLTRLAVLASEAAGCTQCGLSAGRTHSVFERGSAGATIAFVGEGPGYHEDQQGKPFVGQAGALLNKMIAAMGLTDEDVYICNVVKCRPPDNRTPTTDEAQACMGFLEEQLSIVAPKVIVALGKCAAEHLGQLKDKRWRGQWGSYKGIDVISTYHPAFLLRSPQFKRPVWEDLQSVMKRIS